MSVNIKTQDGWKRVAGKGTLGSDTQISKLSELQDVSISDITNGQILIYNATSGKWTNVTQVITVSSDDVIYNRYPLTDQLVTSEVINVTFTNGVGTVNIDPHNYMMLGARLENEEDFSTFFINYTNDMAHNNFVVDIRYIENHLRFSGNGTFPIRVSLLPII